MTSISINHDFFATRAGAKKSLMGDDYPDIELVLGVSSLTGDTSGSFRNLLGLTDEFYKEIFGDYEGLDAFTIIPVLMRPKSRGRLTLRSSNPFHWPVIDINYYDDEDDLNTMVRGIKKVITSISYIFPRFIIYYPLADRRKHFTSVFKKIPIHHL